MFFSTYALKKIGMLLGTHNTLNFLFKLKTFLKLAIYIYIYTHIYIHTHTHTHIYTYIYTHTYIYILVPLLPACKMEVVS